MKVRRRKKKKAEEERPFGPNRAATLSLETLCQSHRRVGFYASSLALWFQFVSSSDSIPRPSPTTPTLRSEIYRAFNAEQ